MFFVFRFEPNFSVFYGLFGSELDQGGGRGLLLGGGPLDRRGSIIDLMVRQALVLPKPDASSMSLSAFDKGLSTEKSGERMSVEGAVFCS